MTWRGCRRGAVASYRRGVARAAAGRVRRAWFGDVQGKGGTGVVPGGLGE